MECFPGQSKSGSSKINALIALITINVDVNCTYSHLSSLVAVEVVEVEVNISSSDAFKLGLPPPIAFNGRYRGGAARDGFTLDVDRCRGGGARSVARGIAQ